MGHASVRIPYSTPWYKPQLDDMLKEIEKYKRQVSLMKMTLAEVAKERDAALASGRKSTETIGQLCDDAVGRENLKTKAIAEAEAAKEAVKQGQHEREMLQADNARLRARVQTLQCEVDDLKNSMSGYVEDRIQAERAAADEKVAAARAQGEARAAMMQAKTISDERDQAIMRCQQAQAEVKSLHAAEEGEAQRAEEERKARLEALILDVKPLSKETIGSKAAELSYLEGEELAKLSSKYTDPEAVWSMLEPQNFDGLHDTPVMLLSANWLKTQRPARLPERAKLPPEAFINGRALRTIFQAIDKGLAKGMVRPLPIVCALLPKSTLGGGACSHPDPAGACLEQLVNALDLRWNEFARQRGGIKSTGVTDIGVFIDWACMYQAPDFGEAPSSTGALSARGAAPARKRNEHEQAVFDAAQKDVHILFAHTLTTVWMLPEGKHSVGPKEIKYTEAWPSYLYLLASILKPSNLNELLAWPQMLDLAGVKPSTDPAVPIPNGHYEQEKICRRAPPEPLTFARGHEHGSLVGAGGLVAEQYPEALCAMLAGAEELDFRRCCWGDEEAAWLALVLPLCGRLQRLFLSGNQIGNAGACALATAIQGGALRSLKMLTLDNNEIGDTGALSLFQSFSPAEGAPLAIDDLKQLLLNNNAINDTSAIALAGAISSSNCLAGCKVNLDGNPATKATKKVVKKALKKARKP